MAEKQEKPQVIIEHDIERRHIMQIFDNFHKIITYISGVGIVWLITTVNTNQDNALILQGKLDAMNTQLQNAIQNRYTSIDAQRDKEFYLYRIDEVQKQVDKLTKVK